MDAASFCPMAQLGILFIVEIFTKMKEKRLPNVGKTLIACLLVTVCNSLRYAYCRKFRMMHPDILSAEIVFLQDVQY